MGLSRSNGFLEDFLRAQANFNLTGNAFCTTAGCQTLTIFGKTPAARIRVGTAAAGETPRVSLATFNASLGSGGVPGNLALSILQVNADVNPTLATPQFPLVPNPNTGGADVLLNGARLITIRFKLSFAGASRKGYLSRQTIPLPRT